MTHKEWIEYIQPYLKLSENEILALTLYGEARGESWEGIIAVLNIIKNRAKKIKIKEAEDYRYKKYHAVVLKQWQFSCFLPGDPNKEKIDRIANDIELEIKKDSLLAALLHTCVIKYHLIDNTFGADHYYADYIDPPWWALKMKKTIQIGKHIFLKS